MVPTLKTFRATGGQSIGIRSFAREDYDVIGTTDNTDATDTFGKYILLSEFNNDTDISIQSSNLFKISKYLNKVFRPTKYGGFYKDLDIHVSYNKALTTKVTDGISLISLVLAKSLGYSDSVENNSTLFTQFHKD